ncbi:MAG: Rpn family recombination-promoting nuclease/putative transposase [Agathobacter sp.]|nr:Rpn family recombination-promoting nuclease/putative transposase [Agathobacter sp.]
MTNLKNTKSISKPNVPYEQATGSTKYGLTNDYMFRVVFQENELARKGLIASVLHISPKEIYEVKILNPIELGDHIDDKDFILDIKVLLNNGHLINLEMQMTDQHNWQDRSLSYLCRSFDQLYKGEEYTEAKPATHIGFLNFTPFSEQPEFNGCYKLLNTKNHTLYSDKFTFHVVDLTHIELATEEDKSWQIDYWARLFTATTWEEVKMIAENDIHMKEAAKQMYVFSADETIEERCRARNDYQKQINTHNRTLRELEEANQTIEAQQREIESLQQELARLKSQK